MSRFKAVAAGSGVLVALLVGLAVVHGSWWWNAVIEVDGTQIRTAWAVVDDPEGAENYHTTIKVKLPRHAVANVVSQATTEVVFLGKSRKLKCTSSGLMSKVTYKVRPLDGADGKRVEVTAYGEADQVLAHKFGKVNRNITVRVLIPGADCSKTAHNSHDRPDDDEAENEEKD